MNGNYKISLLCLLLVSVSAAAKQKNIQRESLAAYVQRMQQQVPELPSGSPGSLWTDSGRLAYLAGDYKAAHVGDLITILVLQDMKANNANSVSTARTFAANSGISALAGHLKTSGVEQIFSPSSSQSLSGKSQASTTSNLHTTLAGRVVAVLASGLLVIEAERQLTMNNERQTVLVRGLVRPGDISPENTVTSNAVGNLELELKGKGVLSDGTHPPNLLVRALLRIVGF
ncbi:MAG: flagellar basal body L-ring protein FlgH [Acidobacteriia bacterium]|nr:flagellar basal body L-ring protein FlgH [Terriglobia bacterium]